MPGPAGTRAACRSVRRWSPTGRCSPAATTGGCSSGSAIHHGETNALENAGRQPASVYRRATMYTTLSPCDMCTGAILLYGIPRVVIGENVTFMGAEDLLRSRGVEVVLADDEQCKGLMREFIAASPELWNEDIGEES